MAVARRLVLIRVKKPSKRARPARLIGTRLIDSATVGEVTNGWSRENFWFRKPALADQNGPLP